MTTVVERTGSTITVKDGTQIYFKDWGAGQPIVFSHGWPLTADAWDAQMVFLASQGYRCIAHDRRGHGRSTQPWNGNEMDTYADDLAALTQTLDLRDAIHVGHSTGGGEVARYLGRHGTGRVAKAVLIGAVPPLMLKTPNSPGGLPIGAFDQMRAAVTADRSQFFKDLTLPFYGYNRPNVKVSEGVRESFWLQGMMAGHKSALDCIKAFSETDFTEDLKENRRTDADHARRRRSDRADWRVGVADSKADQEQHPQGVQGAAPRNVHGQRGLDQSGLARVHQSLRSGCQHGVHSVPRRRSASRQQRSRASGPVASAVTSAPMPVDDASGLPMPTELDWRCANSCRSARRGRRR